MPVTPSSLSLNKGQEWQACCIEDDQGLGGAALEESGPKNFPTGWSSEGHLTLPKNVSSRRAGLPVSVVMNPENLEQCLVHGGCSINLKG